MLIIRYNVRLVFLFAFVIGIASCMFSDSVYAQARDLDIFERFKKPMPKLNLMSEEEFKKATKLIEKQPYGQKALSYSMRIDKSWSEGIDRSVGNYMLSEKLFLELNSFYSKPTISGRSRIEVSALNIESNLTAEQWYIKYILEGGYTTEGFVVHNTDKVESLMIVMERDYSYYLRTLVLLNGNKVLMVKYFVPVQYIQEQAVMQQMVINSFRIKHKEQRKYAGMLSYRFLDIAEFKYPKNWKIYAKPVRNVDRLEVSLLNTKKSVGLDGSSSVVSSSEGRLDVLVVSAAVKNTLVEEVDEYKRKVESNGILIGEKIKEDYKFTYWKNIDFAITEVYKGIDSTDSSSEYEFWFTILVGGNYYYFVTLLTPSRNNMFATWAENTQSYKVMMKEFKPMVGAFLERD